MEAKEKSQQSHSQPIKCSEEHKYICNLKFIKDSFLLKSDKLISICTTSINSELELDSCAMWFKKRAHQNNLKQKTGTEWEGEGRMGHGNNSEAES